MALDKEKKQNIVTFAIVGIALVLLILVILVKTGVIGANNTEESTSSEVETESSIVVIVETKEDGESFSYTMLEYYTKPGISANHRYPPRPTKSTTETTSEFYYIEETSVIAVTDENGEPVTDENGEPVTKIKKYTIPCDKDGSTSAPSTTKETTTVTTSERTTKIVYRTDPFSKKPLKNIKGEYMTLTVLTEPEPTTTAKPTTTETTTKPTTDTTASTQLNPENYPSSTSQAQGSEGTTAPPETATTKKTIKD